ncbi:uncharacterized protein ColSpa_10539 [Colletotrichum spaethianum]|uniref:Uncharacterized protein n=1 Tax=Colletotrichum spaethianum TaxID=700344 RepID=A0AA37USR8_9PEZI|nr:uncharacterized protein ColSpa_10539 [Colletotrichum spaethianum]GKT50358.1 hypothetical protein ColSpa_10539 [Colletotrichum spaethianum]
MCDWEEFLFTCNHSIVRLKSYCHFARNDPNHQCFGVKVLRNSWQQSVPCNNCISVWQDQERSHFVARFNREECIGDQSRRR